MMIRGSIQEEDLTIVNICTQRRSTSMYVFFFYVDIYDIKQL